MRKVLLAALMAWPMACNAETFRIVDGDTIHLNGTRFRLHGIDAPEKDQRCPDGWPAGQKATAYLARLAWRRVVTCEARGFDRYGRTLGVCFADGHNLNQGMVRDGYAWAYARYSPDYINDERQAKAERAGLHAHDCVPAWEYRQQKRREP